MKNQNTNQEITGAFLPMITTIENNDFFFFSRADQPEKVFAVKCPKGTFSALEKQFKINKGENKNEK